MKPPLSDTLLISRDGRLSLISFMRLAHPVRSLIIPRGHPNHLNYVKFSIW